MSHGREIRVVLQKTVCRCASAAAALTHAAPVRWRGDDSEEEEVIKQSSTLGGGGSRWAGAAVEFGFCGSGRNGWRCERMDSRIGTTHRHARTPRGQAYTRLPSAMLLRTLLSASSSLLSDLSCVFSLRCVRLGWCGVGVGVLVRRALSLSQQRCASLPLCFRRLDGRSDCAPVSTRLGEGEGGDTRMAWSQGEYE